MCDNNRRTFYAQVSRHNLNDFLRLFDFPDPNITSDKRTVTTVPLQQLFVLNSDFMVRQAQALAKRIEKVTAADDGRIRAAFPLLYGRPATEAEVQLGLEFLHASPGLDDKGQPVKSQLTPWEQYAQILLGANEFNFVD